MTGMIAQLLVWPTLGVALLVFGFAPGVVLRLIVLLYRRGNPRRQELMGELYAVPRIERPFWVAEQLEVALFEGLSDRFRASKPPPRLSRVGSVMRMSEDDTRVARPTAFYGQPEITPGEFEEFVAKQLLGSADSEVNDLSISLHEKITGADGTYDFDTTVRYQFAGMSFLVLVEAKLHKNPIKRELVQVLHQKMQSVGAHKGLMVSTAPYQTGAVIFAKAHGIALVTVTEGRFVYETRDVLPVPQMSREEAAVRFGLPTFVGHYYGPGDEPGFTRVWLLSPDNAEYPRHIAELLLCCPSR